MGVGLQPLEFSECLADSPAFRDNLHRHEKELERTSQQIKRLVKEVKDVVQAARRLGAAQLALADSMEQFEFACIGASQTEDERIIGRSLHHFAHLIRTIEDERDRMACIDKALEELNSVSGCMLIDAVGLLVSRVVESPRWLYLLVFKNGLGRAHEQIIQPLERFRKEHIGAVKEGKKKFEKKTAKFCQTQERTLALSVRKPDTVFQEADAAMDMAERDFCQASLEYVFQLQAVQERKKFELVETLLGFVFGWWTFHHTAHDVHADAEPRVRDLQLRIQRTRSNFEETSKQTESLMKKMMEMRQQSKEEEISEEAAQRAGYLFLQEKKAFGTAWSKQYGVFERVSRELTLTPYNQMAGRGGGGAGGAAGESVPLAGARPPPDPPDRRFCWEALPQDRDRPPLLLQALSERDRSSWLRAVQSPAGQHPPHPAPPSAAGPLEAGDAQLDAQGFDFVRRLIAEIEARGLDEQGLYRVAGVASKTARLVSLGAAGGAGAVGATLSDPHEWESRTLTSALKAFLRALPDRLLTARLHTRLIHAAKLERRWERVAALHSLVRMLPQDNLDMLKIVLTHLRKVAAHSDKNLMSASNLAVCWGPTLLHADTGTVASILDLKFCNVLVETMLEHYHDIFESPSPPAAAAPPAAPTAPLPPSAALPAPQAPPHSHAHTNNLGINSHALQQNGVLRTSPPGAGGLGVRSDIVVRTDAPMSCERGARYSPHHHHLLQQLGGAGGVGVAARALPRAPASTSSSAESVSECSASPPPPHPAPSPMVIAARGAGIPGRAGRARTLYACLGESEGELSFEPNQILTNVTVSAEPGWLRATLNGRTGLVPENYVEPLP